MDERIKDAADELIAFGTRSFRREELAPGYIPLCPMCVVRGGQKVHTLDAVEEAGGFRQDGRQCADHGFMTWAQIAACKPAVEIFLEKFPMDHPSQLVFPIFPNFRHTNVQIFPVWVSSMY